MIEILGLLDALESEVLESKKIPLTEKIILEEKRIVDLIDKIRKTIHSNGNIVHESVNINEEKNMINDYSDHTKHILEDEEKVLAEAKKIKNGADEYAQYILTSLQLTIAKMQTNLIKLEKNIESGIDIINKKTEGVNLEQIKKEEINTHEQ